MAMAMAMAMALWNQKQKIMLFVNPMLHLQCTEHCVTITAKTNNLQTEEAYGNGNQGSMEFPIRDDVRRQCNQGTLKEAVHRGLQPDSSLYACLLQRSANTKCLSEGKLAHGHIIVSGFHTDIYLQTKLVIMYAKCGCLWDARQVFDKMSERNVVSWTGMISAYAKHGQGQEALRLFYQMQWTSIHPNHFTFASVLPACASLEAVQHGRSVHGGIIRGGFGSDAFVGSALVDMYIKCGSIEDAHQVFDQMAERDAVSWNAMIAGYAQNGYVGEAWKLFHKTPAKDVVSWTVMIAGFAQNGHFSEALKLFGQMQRTVVKPDSVTFSSVLSACACLAALEHGKEVHEDIIRSGFHSDVSVGNALVDMYAKSGRIEDACKVFDKMPNRDVVSWNAMIGAYAMHGNGKEALQLFEEMQRSGTKQNRVTLVGVLSACCHAGLVEDGWQYFDRMRLDYNITPGAEHYCCMVDLLGRAGRLDEAEDFISKMPMKPHACVWRSLLGACRIHANLELGERVAEHLFESDPETAGHYVLLSNIYAAAGRWNDADKVRKLMKDRKIKKSPGCSWIEVNNKLFAFLVGDRSHPQSQEIYAKLETLFGQMKELGYVPQVNFALHDVEEEQKEHILCYHSEKLAIAFGLIHTSHGTPIRIVKNLRVCGDCHSATKLISKIVAREIVVRDANRFHHFKDGWCSCGDYW